MFLQDVVFAMGRDVDSIATAKRARVLQLSELEPCDRLQEKSDLRDLREGFRAKGQYKSVVVQ